MNHERPAVLAPEALRAACLPLTLADSRGGGVRMVGMITR